MPKRNRSIVQNGLLTDDAIDGIQVGSRRWHAWLADHVTFVFQGNAGHFTALR